MNKKNLFNNEYEAKNILKNSREEIDKIDKEIISLISKRTLLAKDIINVKIFLGMDIYDKNREKVIYDKVSKLAIDKNIDKNILIKIMNILTKLSKDQQKEILKRKKNGKY
ncbi:MAG: chorismate mutase [Methanobacteriaceae archaeon]|jgi:chorismate mutase|nr:chorismate mutase [Candidatus Methanorudis spinitermitis]